MFVITVTFETHPENADAFREAVLRQAANSLNKEAGCRRFDVSQDAENPHRFFLYEFYDDRDAFQLHLESAHYLDFDAKTKDWVTLKAPEGWNLLED